jgi:AcrR family transcriptional regulator
MEPLTPKAVRMRERIMDAARRLALHKPLDRIGLSEVARVAGVSWPTVKRHVGSKEQLRRVLLREMPELAGALPDTRQRLLAAAVPVFARDGYEGATLDEIAASAGLTKGAVYWHFEAKHDLFGALLGQYAQEQQAVARDSLERAAAAERPQAAWETLLFSQLGRASGNPQWGRLVLEFVARGARCEQQGQLREAVTVLDQAASELAAELQRRGQMVQSVDPADVGAVVSMLAYGLLVSEAIRPGRSNLRAAIATVARLLERGLAPPPLR